MKKPIYVTQSSLAPLEELQPYLEKIWDRGVLSNYGPLVPQFEKELAMYLDVPHVICVSSGTSALQLAIRALDIKGEVITTPFTFIATANIISWEHCTPIFVDICPDTWNIDAEKIEASITAQTTAILAVHVFSAPCNTTKITEIANKHNLQLIFDAAHAIAVKHNGKSLLKYGKISTLSFHATKMLNTAEGGACITNDEQLANKLRQLRYFGFNEEKEIVDTGINAKMSEISAALGLVNLAHLDTIRNKRRIAYESYRNHLAKIPFIQFQRYQADEYNYSYLPILLESEERLKCVMSALEKYNVCARRYFYPALHTLAHFKQNNSLPIAEKVADRILCLPLYDALTEDEIQKICNIIDES